MTAYIILGAVTQGPYFGMYVAHIYVDAEHHDVQLAHGNTRKNWVMASAQRNNHNDHVECRAKHRSAPDVSGELCTRKLSLNNTTTLMSRVAFAAKICAPERGDASSIMVCLKGSPSIKAKKFHLANCTCTPCKETAWMDTTR